MIKKIKNYVDQIFDEKPKTKKASELKDELIANLIEKYNDLLTKGKTEEEAYNTVIASIGDIDELITELDDQKTDRIIYNSNERKKNAKYIAIAVSLYIVSLIPAIYFGEVWGLEELGAILMFAIVAVATGMLVYIGASKPKYLKENDTLVEEFKEWKSQKKQKDSLKSAIISSTWFCILAVYFIVSFLFQIWAYSWIIFLLGAAITQIIKAVFEYRGN